MQNTMSTASEDASYNALLRRVIEPEGSADDIKITIKPGSEAGEGFLGIKSAIEVESKGKILKLFVKAATKNEKLRDQINMKEIFRREIYFYETIYPEFIKFQLEHNVEEPFNNVPKCYMTSMENSNEILIFENLKEQGYVMYDKKVQVNEQYLKFIFQLYGRFHAISYAMKDQDPRLYAKLSGNLNDLVGGIIKPSGIDVAFSHYCEEVKNFFDPIEDASISSRIENINEITMDTMTRVDEFVDDYSVITHGDCWFNNFLFKYKDSNDQRILEDVKVLDWQMMRVNSPVLDLSYFFYGVASKASMDNLDYYLKTYHDTLSGKIREMGSDPEKLYPYSVFKEHWKKFSRYGLIMSFGILKVMLVDKEDAPDPTEAIESGKNFGDAFVHIVCDDQIYKQKIRDVVEHFVNNNFI